jgi:putative ABC transport system permease protein
MWRAHLPGYLAVLVVVAGGAAVASATGTVVRAATTGAGLDRVPDAERQRALDLVQGLTGSLLGVALGVAVFASCFLATSTTAFALDARQREHGLLRLLGATPRQVARLCRGEAAVLGLLAGIAGAVVGVPVAGPVQAALARAGLSDERLDVGFSWAVVAGVAALSLTATMVGAWGPARRAGATEPARALALPGGVRRAMGPARWVVGGTGVAGAAAMLLVPVPEGADPDGAVALALGVSFCLVVGLAAWAPLVVPAVVGAVAPPLRRLAPAVGLLAPADARQHARRTAALAAPLLQVVGLYSGLVTIAESARGLPGPERAAVAADLVLSGGHGTVSDRLAACRQVAGVAACTATAVVPGHAEFADGTRTGDVRAVDPASAATVLGVEGDVAAIGGDVVGVGPWAPGPGALTYVDGQGGRHPVTGGPLVRELEPYWAEDVLLGFDQLAAWGLPDPPEVEVWVVAAPGAGPQGAATLGPGLATALGGEVRTVAEWLDARRAADEALNRGAMVALFGGAEVLALVSVVVTCASSARDRRDQLSLLQRSGAGPRQVLGAAAVEALLVTGIAGLLLLVVQAFVVMRIGQILPGVPVVTPWPALGVLFGAGSGLALMTSLAATWWVARATDATGPRHRAEAGGPAAGRSGDARPRPGLPQATACATRAAPRSRFRAPGRTDRTA